VQWISAHTSENSVGQRRCSDGVRVSHDYWCANQLVDLLAKESAESIRPRASGLNKIQFTEQKVYKLVLYLGRLTFEVNIFALPGGWIGRDSDSSVRRSCRQRGALLGKNPRRVTKGIKVPAKDTSNRPKRSTWQQLYTAKRKGLTCPLSKHANQKGQHEAHLARQEAAFQSWWRGSRDARLQPRSQVAVDASERFDA